MQLTNTGGRRVAIAAIACLPLIVGCGGSKDAGSSTAPQGATGGSVEDQLGFTRNGVAAASAKVENQLASCMKAEGFEYIPSDPIAQQAALTGKANVSDEEYEKQFGYGISTLYGRGSAQSDPNEKIRSGLGEADRASYDRALSGGRPDQTFAFAVDTGEFSELGGCTKQATESVFGGSELLQSLQRKLDELDESVVSDQRVVRAIEAWRGCMKIATGESYEDAESIEDQIKERFEKVVGSVVPPGQVAPADAQADASELAKLQTDELDLFTKDLACENKHISPVEMKVREQKEEAFKTDNADLLSKVKPLGS